MSKAREIAEERLAKGEITEEEFDLILESLARTESIPSSENAPREGWSGALKLAGIVFFGIFIFGIFSNAKQNKVEIINLESSGFLGDTVSGKLITEGSSGTVYIWVEMNKKIMCPKKTFIQNNVPQPFKFYCPEMSEGRFKVVSQRNPSDDWVKNNATSL